MTKRAKLRAINATVGQQTLTVQLGNWYSSVRVCVSNEWGEVGVGAWKESDDTKMGFRFPYVQMHNA